MSDWDELQRKVEALSPAGVRFVVRFIDAIADPPSAEYNSSTWLSDSPEWIESMSLAIAAHHAVTTEPIMYQTFETVFRDACENVGWTVSPHGSATQRFVDMWVEKPGDTRRNLSMKSTAPKKLSKNLLSISKLTEINQFKQQTTQVLKMEFIQRLFSDYRDAVDSIVQLRCFRPGVGQMPTKYQLVEMPVEIFDGIADLSPSDFAAVAPRLKLPFADHDVGASVNLDHSDEKVTIGSVPLAICTIHAEWNLSTAGA